MEKFEKILSLFIKNPYIHIQLSKEFLNSFRGSVRNSVSI